MTNVHAIPLKKPAVHKEFCNLCEKSVVMGQWCEHYYTNYHSMLVRELSKTMDYEEPAAPAKKYCEICEKIVILCQWNDHVKESGHLKLIEGIFSGMEAE